MKAGLKMKIKTAEKIFKMFLINHFLSGTVFFEGKRKMLNSIGFELGEGTKVVGPLYCSGTLKTGENCWIGRDLAIEGNGTVILGDNCDVAPQVTFLTGGHEIGDSERRAGKGQKYIVRVGSGTWICARATVGKNINIGESSIIAACSCVVNDVEKNTLAGGVPAKVIKKLDV